MELAETVAVAILTDLLDKCPFTKKGPPVSKKEKEDVWKDDSKAATKKQANNGGILGENLGAASAGDPATINGIAKPPTPAKAPRVNGNVKLENMEHEGTYPYKVAAHHLIPGGAALMHGDSYLKDYMYKPGKITTEAGKTYKLKEHIGYNVNGAHNGVWLPGNYAIRKGSSPKKGKGGTWGKIVDTPEYKDWCFEYMRACVGKVGRQFHDAHPMYSEAVLGVLNKIHSKLTEHQDTDCKHCKSKEIYPPYELKRRLYNFSAELKIRLSRPMRSWRYPWCTSDKFKTRMAEKGMISTVPGW